MKNLPGGVPVSECFCEEHAPEHTLKPLSCQLVVLVVAIVGLVAWLAHR